MNKGRLLQIFRDGRKHKSVRYLKLPPGSQGNLETLEIMAQIVREDSKQNDLRNYFLREIVHFETSQTNQVKKAFEYCKDKILYANDKPGFETVADFWSCVYAFDPKTAIGDCSVKSVCLATILGSLGMKPHFIAVKQTEKQDYFNHVFVGLNDLSLDPTPKEFKPGNEIKSVFNLKYKIF